MAETQIIITARDMASGVFRNVMLASKDLTAGIAGLGMTLAGALSAERIVSLAVETVKAQDAMGKLAQATGLTVEGISSYSYAAQMSGASSQSMSVGVRSLSKNLVEAQRAGSDVALVFKTIGVSTKDADGKLRSTGAVLADIADRFASYEEGPAKVDLATRIFGKSGNELIPLLNQGSAGLARMSEEARKAGVALSSGIAESASRVNDGWERMAATSEGMRGAIVGGMLPAFESTNAVMERTAASVESIDIASKALSETWKGLVMFGVGLKNSLEMIVAAGAYVVDAFTLNASGASEDLRSIREDSEDISKAWDELYGKKYRGPRIDENAFFGIDAAKASGKSPVPDIPTDAAAKLEKAAKLRIAALAAADALTQLDLKAQATSASLSGDVAGADALNRRAESAKNLSAVQRELLGLESERAQLLASGKATPEALAALDDQTSALKAQVPIYQKLTALASELAAIQERARLREQSSAHATAMAGFTGGLGVWDARRQAIVSKYDTLREAPATKRFQDDWDQEQAAALAQVNREQARSAAQASEAYARMRGDVSGMAQAQMEQLRIELALAETEEQRVQLSGQIAQAQAQADGDMAEGARQGFRDFAREATDAYSQARSASAAFFSSASDGLARLIVLGDDLGSTLENLSVRFMSMSLDANLLGPLAKVMGGASLSEAGGFLSIFSAKGNVFQSADLSSLSGRIVDRPTVFGFDRHLTAFAKGGGVMGEAGPEAVLKLYRDRDGVLGVKGSLAGGAGTYVFSPQLNVTAPPSSGNAARDDAHLKALTALITTSLESSFNDMLDKAMRPGGKLNGGVRL